MYSFGRTRAFGVAVDLQPGDPQAMDAVPLDGPLPAEQLLDRQAVAQGCFLQANQAKANSLDDGGIAPERPTHGVGWGKFDRHPPEMARCQAQLLDNSGQ
jgi:hypothetical protein